MTTTIVLRQPNISTAAASNGGQSSDNLPRNHTIFGAEARSGKMRSKKAKLKQKAAGCSRERDEDQDEREREQGDAGTKLE